MKRLFALAVFMAMFIAAPVDAATIPVTSLNGSFTATNPSVARTSDGIQFGPYSNGGSAGGSVYYTGANGMTLGQISALAYTLTYNTTDDNPIGAPYLRIFLEGDTHDVIFSPSTQPVPETSENVLIYHNVVAGTARYDDDPGAGPDSPFTDIQAAHAGEVISGIYVTAGFAAGLDLSALLTDVYVNADRFCFNCEPTVPTPPAPAPTGTGEVVVVTTVIDCDGDAVRFIRAPKRKGEKFLSAKATLRGKRLKVHGRRIKVNLRHHPEANYNIKITSKYRKPNGHIHKVETERHLSVVCA